MRGFVLCVGLTWLWSLVQERIRLNHRTNGGITNECESASEETVIAMRSIRCVLLLLMFVGSGVHAQEIRYIDLSLAGQRTELRHPRGDCREGMVCVGTGGGSAVDGA